MPQRSLRGPRANRTRTGIFASSGPDTQRVACLSLSTLHMHNTPHHYRHHQRMYSTHMLLICLTPTHTQPYQTWNADSYTLYKPQRTNKRLCTCVYIIHTYQLATLNFHTELYMYICMYILYTSTHTYLYMKRYIDSTTYKNLELFRQNQTHISHKYIRYNASIYSTTQGWLLKSTIRHNCTSLTFLWIHHNRIL